MPQFIPRLEPAITTSLLARFIARSGNTDVSEGGVVHSLFKTTGEEFAGIEAAIQNRLNTRLLDVSGPDLDEAVDLFTAGAVPRAGPASASGPCLRLTRSSSTGALVVPKGTTYGRSDNPAVVYVQDVDVTIPDGDLSYGEAGSYVAVTCATPGADGNCQAGTINTIQSGAPPGLQYIEQMTSIGGGVTRETDPNYRDRARLFAAAQADRATTAAQLYIARTYQSTSGVRARHASAFWSPDMPAYSEIVVDDGTSFIGQSRPGATVTVEIKNNLRVVQLEGPIADDNLLTSQVLTASSGSGPFSPTAAVQWTLVPEAGQLWLDAGVFASGTFVRVQNYTVYTGFVAQLQQVLFGQRIGPFGQLSCIASGARVRVTPPTAQLINIHLQIDPVLGADLTTLADQCEAALTEYLASLAPGQSFLLIDAYTALRENVPGLLNATFLPTLTDGITPAVAEDWPPQSDRYSLRLGTFEAT